MSNKSPYTNDPNYPSSGYPPPPHSQYPHSDEYKASYDDLVDQYAEPYSKTSQHQTFSPALSTAVHQPPYMSKQSYSSEMTGKDSEEHYMPSSTPRILPMKEEKVADTRTVWQKVSTHPLCPLSNGQRVDIVAAFSRFCLSLWRADYMFAQSLCKRS